MQHRPPASASIIKPMPDFSIENVQDHQACGIDEVGRGPLAGPVVAACVYIPPEKRALPYIHRIRDSKTLSEARLEELSTLIRADMHFGIGECCPEEIDALNIQGASHLAMERAYASMIQDFNPPPAMIALIDGNRLPKNLPATMLAVIKGDTKSTSIAAASIIAKAHRDSIMSALALEFPHYGWETNVGYPTKTHLEALILHGITPHHRRSFAPVKARLAA